MDALSFIDYGWIKRLVPIAWLAILWSWESWRPFFGNREQRWGHGLRNLALAVANHLLLAGIFGSALVGAIEWAQANQFGLLRQGSLNGGSQLILGLLLLDGWMYLWHRLNHLTPWLWRFHRVHHSDPHMDATTATRFHLGELAASALLRLAVVPLLGVDLQTVLIYDTLAVIVTQFHHADISLGRCDRWLRAFIVTPDMHKVHHSDWRPETDSNFSTIFSWWDRLAGTLRRRATFRGFRFGLEKFSSPEWEEWWKLWGMPLKGGNEPKAEPLTAEEKELVSRS